MMLTSMVLMKLTVWLSLTHRLASLPQLLQQLPLRQQLQLLLLFHQQLLHQQPRAGLALMVGLEGSAWIHLVLDGDPWPQEWWNKRQR